MWRALGCAILVACGSSPSGGDDDPGDDAAVVGMPLTPDEAARACVYFGGCLGDGINDCFTDAMPFWSPAEARCVLAAGADCTAVRACFGMTIVIDPACTTRTTTCDGANLVTCSDGVRSTVSCPDASPVAQVGTGPNCVPTTTGSALCGVASCSTGSASCSGSVASSCVVDKGVQMSLDCATYGQSCVDGLCTAPGGGGACASGTLARCDGTAIVRCSGGIERRTDCSTIVAGASCQSGTATDPELYCGASAACYPTKDAETCSGNTVTFCSGGEITSLDCTALGFTRCFSGGCVTF